MAFPRIPSTTQFVATDQDGVSWTLNLVAPSSKDKPPVIETDSGETITWLRQGSYQLEAVGCEPQRMWSDDPDAP